jgi:hypothetical protein
MAPAPVPATSDAMSSYFEKISGVKNELADLKDRMKAIEQKYAAGLQAIADKSSRCKVCEVCVLTAKRARIPLMT